MSMIKKQYEEEIATRAYLRQPQPKLEPLEDVERFFTQLCNGAEEKIDRFPVIEEF
jgi:hypothetical protein